MGEARNRGSFEVRRHESIAEKIEAHKLQLAAESGTLFRQKALFVACRSAIEHDQRIYLTGMAHQ